MSSDQRVHVPATRLYTYPDVTVACGDRRYTDDDPPSLLNPTLLVEITSDSSEEYDRGTKFLHYQAIVALKEYVIVSHREERVDHHRRLESGQWLVTAHLGEDAIIDLPVFGASVRLADLYAKVDLGEGRSGDGS
jgi:Uma2 family endonuclease